MFTKIFTFKGVFHTYWCWKSVTNYGFSVSGKLVANELSLIILYNMSWKFSSYQYTWLNQGELNRQLCPRLLLFFTPSKRKCRKRRKLGMGVLARLVKLSDKIYWVVKLFGNLVQWFLFYLGITATVTTSQSY